MEQLLKQQGLDEQLRQSLLHGLLLADDSCVAGGAAPPAQRRLTGAEALHRLRTFVQSVGRYGAGTGADAGLQRAGGPCPAVDACCCACRRRPWPAGADSPCFATPPGCF